jgi:DNA-binding IscR family transcriptional regulator
MVCASEDPAHAGICERTGFCNVNHLWLTVRSAISTALDSITLADLAVPRARHPFHSQPIQVAPAVVAQLTES